MSSLGSILGIATSAMQASQAALQTTSQNIANASVEGYSVQSVRMAAQTPQRFTYGNLGTGVVVQGITQARDRLLDSQFRAATGGSANATATSDTLGRIEQVLGEPSTTGLANSLDAFWNSWSDLANDPTSLSARGVVRQRGADVAGQLNSFASQLDGIASDTRATLTSDVSKINDLARQIAGMAPAIVATEVGGQSANDLRDTRNRMIDQMASLADTQVVDRQDGSVGIYLGGRLLVDGSNYHQITASGQPVTVSFAGEADAIQDIGGSIGASASAINQTIPGVMTDLDTLASTLVTETNAVHNTGSPAGDFFTSLSSDPTALTASGISVSKEVLANVANVAASAAGTGPGNNSVANQLAALRDTQLLTVAGAQVSIGAFYRYTVSSVALASSQSSNQATVQSTLASQADTRRQSVSGVSTDEELVNMIKQQQAYQAAAKLISVVDQMSQTLINLGQ